MLSRKTKIVCSQGPAVDNDEMVEKLIIAGMNIARFNFSHGNHEEHKIRIERVKKCAKKLQAPVALLLDTKGPEIRTGLVKEKKTVTIHKDDTVLITVDDTPTQEATKNEPAKLSLNWQDFAKRATQGVRVLIADGLLELEVQHSDGTTVQCNAKNTAEIGSKKNVNIIGLHAGLPIITDTDKADIAFGVKMDVDFIAASFVSFSSEITEIRDYLDSLGSKARIIAKIENEEGLDNIQEIIAVADGIMVARGDLGVQLPT
ncbi:MAG: pyruvate kinase, partial [Spirochaetales bacterium]